MSDAPERIWAWDDENCTSNNPHNKFTTEYIRADLHAAAIARAERAEAALALLHSRASDLLFCYRHGNGLDGWHKAADGLDDALAKIAALKGGAESLHGASMINRISVSDLDQDETCIEVGTKKGGAA